MKTSLEYKVNLINSIFVEVFFTLGPLYFGYILMSNFSDVIKWSFTDYYVFFYFVDLSIVILGGFCWGKGLFKNLQSGYINLALIRPGSRFLNYYFDFKFNGFLFFIVDHILFFPILLYLTNFNFLMIFLAYLIWFFIILAFILLNYLVESISFFSSGLNQFFINFTKSFNEVLRVYPSNYFSLTNFKFIFIIAPIYFVPILINPLFYSSYEFNFDYFLNFTLLLVIIFISSILLHFIWKKGLKKYEGFN